MACAATLKRTHEFEYDPLHSPSQTTPIKRRRCMPISQTPPPTKLSQPSSFSAASPKLTKEEIAARIESELKLLQRRKQLFSPTSQNLPLTTCSSLGRQSPSQPTDSPSSSVTSSDFPFLSSHSSPCGTASPKQKDVPLFTFRQVAMICERAVSEHEVKLRESYEKVLSNKMSEQYEAFLKFNHDQVQKHLGSAPMSYVS